VAVRRIDFRIGDLAAVADQRLHDFAAALRREAPVGGEGSQEELGLGAGQRLGQIAAMGARGSK
jgi:hypothetical protein